MNCRWVGAALCVMAAGGAWADAPLIVLDRGRLPFDLGPGAPVNSPARASNGPNAAWNSGGNSANSASVRGNQPGHPKNSERLIFTSDGTVLGYYAPNAGGVMNLFDVNGRRVAYAPGRGTKSLFSTAGAWCGTVDGQIGGSFVLAMTPDCARLFSR